MNPREFCRESGYSSAILLTYSFDPVFFENLVLRDLWAGGIRNIVVIADSNEVQTRLEYCIDRLRHLGNSYRLGLGNRAAFHPKMIIKTGPSGGKIWIGSGNITQGGWGGNNEVATIIDLPEEEPTAGPLAHGLLAQITEYCNTDEIKDTISDILDTEWIRGSEEQVKRPELILTSPDIPLFNQLRERWEGRSFNTLRVFTGSSDREGRFIQACHEAFGIEQCVVTVDPSTASFEPDVLESLPVTVTIASAPSRPYLHAKFYLFEGDEGNSAIAGSANCSSMAWRISPNEGGNVEAITVYDEVNEADYREFLSKYTIAAKPPAEILNLSNSKEPPVSTAEDPCRIIQLKYMSSSSTITVELAHPIELGAKMVLELGEETLELGISDGKQKILAINLSSALETSTTCFGRLRVWVNEKEIVGARKWMDDLETLGRASQRRGFRKVAKGLNGSNNSNERNKFLNELQFIRQSIFKESDSGNRLVSNTNEPGDDKKERIRSPEELVRGLAEITTADSRDEMFQVNMRPVGFSADLKELFFDMEDEEDPDKGKGKGKGNSSGEKPKTTKTRKGQTDPTEAQKKRFKGHMESFFRDFESSFKLDHFRAHKLLSASLFPLLVISKGKQAGWFSAEDSRYWLLKTIEILFKTKIAGAAVEGLLDYRRGKSDDQGDFDGIIGDGSLWLALLEAVTEIEWDTKTHVLERCLVLCDVWRHKSLTRSPNLKRTGLLWQRLSARHRDNPIETHAVRSVEILKEIENFIAKHFDLLIEKQVGGMHATGDIVRRYGDWGSVETQSAINDQSKVNVHWRGSGKSTKMKASGFFVNVTKAVQRYTRLKELVEELHSIYDSSEIN